MLVYFANVSFDCAKDSNTVPKKHPQCEPLNFTVLKLDFPSVLHSTVTTYTKYSHIKLVLGTEISYSLSSCVK